MARIEDPNFQKLALHSREPESNLPMGVRISYCNEASSLALVLTLSIAPSTKAVRASQKERMTWLVMPTHEHDKEELAFSWMWRAHAFSSEKTL